MIEDRRRTHITNQQNLGNFFHPRNIFIEMNTKKQRHQKVQSINSHLKTPKLSFIALLTTSERIKGNLSYSKAKNLFFKHLRFQLHPPRLRPSPGLGFRQRFRPKCLAVPMLSEQAVLPSVPISSWPQKLVPTSPNSLTQ